jgi:bifunctional DNA-binding transcriptional regulator/antitoxin component of YhaV-PrlF toxin-antitoxin module
MQHHGMVTSLPVSKRGALTLPPVLRRKLGLNQLANPMVMVEERDGGLFLQAAAAVPLKDIPKQTIAQWVARDEDEMAAFNRATKRKQR